MTVGSETGPGHHLLRLAERNEADWANRHDVVDSLCTIGISFYCPNRLNGRDEKNIGMPRTIGIRCRRD